MYDATQEILEGLDPSIQEAAYQLISIARQSGIPMMLISGRRSLAENRRVGGATASRHLYGRAFDVQVLGFTRNEIDDSWWRAVGEFAERVLGLRWGGRFTPKDVNHFDV